MKSKTVTNTQGNSTQTSAPPSWTMPGIAETAKRVTDALDTLPGDRYTGNFVAQPNKDLLGQLQNKLFETSKWADITAKNYMDMAAPFTTGGYDPKFGGPASLDMSQFTAPTMLKAPTIQSIMDQVGLGSGMPEFIPAEILARPDIASFAPTLMGAPDLQFYDPTAFNHGNEAGRLNAALEAATAPIMRQLTEKVLPGLKSSAIDAGAYSGGRAMNIVPQNAIDVATRNASEVASGLAYEGFQAEENRKLQAWQSFEQLKSEAAQGNNNAKLQLKKLVDDASLMKYGIEADAAMQAYGINQDALLENARMSLGAQDRNLSAMMQLAGLAGDLYKTEQGALLDSAGMANNFLLDAFGANTARGSADQMGKLNALASWSDLMTGAMATKGGAADMLSMILGNDTSAQQAGIDNALALDQYNLEYPFRGLDIATGLLSQLSGNWGTTTKDYNEKTTQTQNGGLGEVLKGVAGLAGIAAGAGAFGPLGAAASAANKAGSAANAFTRDLSGLNWGS